MIFLWPLGFLGGLCMLFVGLAMPNFHWPAVPVLAACVAIGSFIGGLRDAAREDSRDRAKMVKCPVWCARNSPPGECTCGECRP